MVRHWKLLAVWLVLLALGPRPFRACQWPDAAANAAQPIAPQETIQLFNGNDLNGWYSYLHETKLEDPHEVFSVRDGAIRISGNGFGYLSTNKIYRDYRLVVEFRWGDRNWGTRIGKARDSGIFLHSRGPEGNSFDGGGAFKAAIECQVMEGAVGDFLLIKGRDFQNKVIEPRLTTRVDLMRDSDGWLFFDPQGQRLEIEGSGRINYLGKDRSWSDVLGIGGMGEIERPVGQWNRVECICKGDSIEVLVNGKLVNRAVNVFPVSGKILLQCEGSEIFFRRVELRPASG